MINWIRKKLGLCVHKWRPWMKIRAGGGLIVGRKRWCRKCGHVQNDYYPDGH